MTVRVAAIDLGTVTARLLLAEVDGEGGGIRELGRFLRITHLGEGLLATGSIGEAALARELAACRDFLAEMDAVSRRDGRPFERTVAVATSAMRDARNASEVCGALRGLGLHVEVIDGLREARLSFLGTLSGFPAEGGPSMPTDGPVLTIDVGGGSTELVLGSVETGKEGARPRILKGRSFDTGSRRVTDRFLKSDPPTAEEMASADRWLVQQMQGYFEGSDAAPRKAIAVAGTATSAVSVRDGTAEYDPWKVHGATVTQGELDAVLDALAGMPLSRRRRCTGLEPGRAPVILGGLMALRTVLRLADMEAFTVSETDILQGIALDAVCPFAA
ncbi:MAG: phosphatase [Coriobacteriales bacterium]|jgi:exopolyphosphatase/guanosine-5'-triphosphate,3'-diphosphate pyrophosphatase|nr:phosphatase [Coriobacteriales bacterium]